jgi:hypothetical protein
MGTLVLPPTSGEGWDATRGHYVDFAYTPSATSNSETLVMTLAESTTTAGTTLTQTLGANGVFEFTGLAPHAAYIYTLTGTNFDQVPVQLSLGSYTVLDQAPTFGSLPARTYYGPNSQITRPAVTDNDQDNLAYSVTLSPLSPGTGEAVTVPIPQDGASVSTLFGSIQAQDYTMVFSATDSSNGTTYPTVTSNPLTIHYVTTLPTLTWSTNPPTYTNKKDASRNPLLLNVVQSNSTGGTKTFKVLGQKYASLDSSGLPNGPAIGPVISPESTDAWPSDSGSYVLTATVTDQADNTVTSSISFNLDTTPPTVSGLGLTGPLNPQGQVLVSSRSVALTAGHANDAYSPISSTYVRWESADQSVVGAWQTLLGASGNNPTLSGNLSVDVPDGVYQLGVKITNQAGTTSITTVPHLSALVDLSVPTITPTVSGALPTSGGYVFSSLNQLIVSATAQDTISSIASGYPQYGVSTNSSAPTTWYPTWSLAQSAAGLSAGARFHVWFKAINGVGLSTVKPGDSQFLYDPVAPTVTSSIVSPATLFAGSLIRVTSNATGTSSGISEYTLSLGTSDDPTLVSRQIPGADASGKLVSVGAGNPVWNTALPGALPKGTYQAVVVATSGAGLSSQPLSQQFSVNQGIQPLTVTDDGPYATGLTATLRATAGSAVDRYEYQVTDVTGGSSQIVVSWKPLDPGVSTVDSDKAPLSGVLTPVNGHTYIISGRAVLTSGSTTGQVDGNGVTIDTGSPTIAKTTTYLAGSSTVSTIFTDGKSLNLSWLVQPTGISPLLSIKLGITNLRTGTHGDFDLPLVAAPSAPQVLSGLDSVAGQQGDRLSLRLQVVAANTTVSQDLSPVYVDQNAPVVPPVIPIGPYNNGAQDLQAQWANISTTSLSPVTYSWQATQTPDTPDPDPSHWTVDLGSHTATASPTRTTGQIWYFVVKATTETGQVALGVSKGILIDQTKPYVTSVKLSGANSAPSAPELTYVNDTTVKDLKYVISSTSAGSPIISVNVNQEGVLSNGTFVPGSVPLTILPDTSGTVDPQAVHIGNGSEFLPKVIYPITTVPSPVSVGATATSDAHNTSDPGYSAGVIYDASLPVITAVRSQVTSNGTLTIDWDYDASPTASRVPISSYSIALTKDGILFQPVGSDGHPLPLTGLTNREWVTNASAWGDGAYSVAATATNLAGSVSAGTSVSQSTFFLDRTIPQVSVTVPSFVSGQIGIQTAINKQGKSGIAEWRYQVGTLGTPGSVTGGWVSVVQNGVLVLSGATAVSLANVPDGSTVQVQVQSMGGTGLWSPVVSTTSIVDKTTPVVTGLTLPTYDTSADRIDSLGLSSTDSQSGIQAYQYNLKDAANGTYAGTWASISVTGYVVSTSPAGLTLAGLTLVHKHRYYLAVKVQNGAGDWGPEALSTQTVASDQLPPGLTFTSPEGQTQVLPGGDSAFVVNSPSSTAVAPLTSWLKVTENVSASVVVSIVLTAPDGIVTKLPDQSLTAFPATITTTLPSIIYGVWSIAVTATDLAGNHQTVTRLVRLNTPPSLNLADLTTVPGKPNLLVPTVLDPDSAAYNDTITSYSWDFGDGSEKSSLANPTHVYHQNSATDASGGYIVTLTVKDNWGGLTTKTAQVTVVDTVSGSLYESETWHGTRLMTGLVSVPTGVTLTIAGDGQIQFGDASQGLVVNGNLVIQDGAKLRLQPGVPAKTWGSVVVAGTAIVKAADISGADRGLAVAANGTATLTGTMFHNNNTGLHVMGPSTVSVSGVQFLNNAIYGIKEDSGGRPKVTNSTFQGNLRAYYQWDGGVLTIPELNQLAGASNGGNQ